MVRLKCRFVCVNKNRLELRSFTKVFNLGACSFKSKELLWGYHNERLSERQSHLSPQQMEVVGSCWAVHYLHIGLFDDICVWLVGCWDSTILISQLQESLDSARWVFWTIAVKTMRKKHHNPVLHIPLCFTRWNKLVDNHLGPICKITELSFPNAQGVWIGLSISKLIAKNCKLWQMGVRGNEASDSSLGNDIV